MFENKMRIFKTQFSQLDGYFRMHDNDSMLDSQSKNTLNYVFCFSFIWIFFWNKLEIVETLKITHRNLLNDAASLKTVHESVEVKTYKHLILNENF